MYVGRIESKKGPNKIIRSNEYGNQIPKAHNVRLGALVSVSLPVSRNDDVQPLTARTCVNFHFQQKDQTDRNAFEPFEKIVSITTNRPFQRKREENNTKVKILTNGVSILFTYKQKENQNKIQKKKRLDAIRNGKRQQFVTSSLPKNF